METRRAPSGLLDVDAIHRAGLRAQVAGDALLDFKKVNPPEPGLKGGRHVGVLQRDGFRETVLQRNPHPDQDCPDGLRDVVKIFTNWAVAITET